MVAPIIRNLKPTLNIKASTVKIKSIIPTISLPGFRKGKAPLSIVKKNTKTLF